MTAQPKHRAYEVLAHVRTVSDREGNAFIHRGIVNAHSADAAIQESVERDGLPQDPYTPTGRYVAVPQSNWNERDVAVTQVPRVEVSQVGEAPQLLPEDAPDELPPVEPEAVA